MRGTPLDQLLEGIEGALVELPVVPAGGPPLVLGVAILDPDDEFGDHHGELVLVIGVRGRESLPFLRAAARSGAVAVAVKPGPSGAIGELAEAATDAGLALLAVRPSVRWDQLGSLLRERLDAAELVGGLPPGTSGGAGGEDLFALAEATALVTGGIVDIEDAANRVLAYSRSDDAVDELRRLSILGWQGPESYMRMLREWGVLDRLRDGEHVVRVDARPDLGIRARLAVGVQAGSRYLGTIWVQQRFSPTVQPFAERAEEALVGAARLAAAEILRRRTGSGPVSGGAQLAELLTGRANTDLVAGRLGLDPAAAAFVVGFSGPPGSDVPARALQSDQVRGMVSVYATAYHRSALVGVLEDRVYAVLSGVPRGRLDPALRSWVRDAVEVVRTRTGQAWLAGVGSPVPGLAALPESRAEADRVLDALARASRSRSPRGAAPAVATISELRSEMLLGEVLDVLGGRPELRHPGIDALVQHDRQRGGELVASLLAYLDALGDVRAAAATLHVHPNTLRYRLRRARAVSKVAWDDPGERLAGHLQLVLVSRLETGAGRA